MQSLRALPSEERDLPSIEQEFCDLAYMVSHDLKTGFRHAVEFSRLLCASAEEGDKNGVVENARIVADAAARCQNMLDQIMAYSFVQQKPLKLGRREASKLVERALGECKNGAGAPGSTVKVHVTGSVTGDEDLLASAFRAVIANAMQFARRDRAATIEIVDERRGGSWVLRVSDDGVGLDRRYWESAFKMFWRLEPRRSSSGGGSGLTLARRIMRRHGGDVRFIPSNEGACVEFTLPYLGGGL
ncbi:MAG: sensor histidine kinase [Pseudomonadota bacterium]